jgi:hypothetical protein
MEVSSEMLSLRKSAIKREFGEKWRKKGKNSRWSRGLTGVNVELGFSDSAALALR